MEERLPRKLDSKIKLSDRIFEQFKKPDSVVEIKTQPKKVYCLKCLHSRKDEGDWVIECRNKRNVVVTIQSRWDKCETQTFTLRPASSINQNNDCAWYSWNYRILIKPVNAAALALILGLVCLASWYFCTKIYGV